MTPSLLILHGAIGASRQMKTIAEKLSERYEVHLFDFPGHGGKSLPGEPFAIKLFSEALLTYVQENNLLKTTVFGYSMGGYVALYLARSYPDLFSGIVTLGTKFHWDEVTAAKEIKMLDPAVIAAKVPTFAAALAEMHGPNDWKEVVRRTTRYTTPCGAG